ncbi:MAG TPA: hypothetical protein VID73_13360 [Ktedonobacterales bacterium]
MNFNQMGSPFSSPPAAYSETATPLIAVFERDDSIAVPLLSQLRVIGYDVRAARTPVELFDIAQKHPVALILVDIGSAAASRREFWVALDAQRRGRSIQVLTFRLSTTEWGFESDQDDSARALADVEVTGTHDLQPIIEATVRKVPLRGGVAAPGAGQWPALGNGLAGALGELPFGSMPPGGLGPGGLGPGGLPFLGGAGGVAPMVLGLNGEGFAPPGYPPGYPQGYPPGYPQGYALPALPQYGAPAGGNFGGAGYDPAAFQAQSPFAHPAGANPFASGSTEPSPFDLPLAANPFTAGGATLGQMPAALTGAGAPPHAFPMAPAGNGHAASPVADAWVPPGTDALHEKPPAPRMPPAGPEPRWNPQAFMPATAEDDTAVGFPTYDTAAAGGWLTGGDDPQAWDATAPVGAQLPIVPGKRDERALGSVLVEGALLTPKKLEVLKGIQHMLSGVEMDFKLGELALLFKFLSPDQLLAALLVSRGVVTPQQIAGLGRIKQELSVSGMDYDLETLLIMFHILPAEDLRRLRQELA